FVASLVLALIAWGFVAPMALALTGNNAAACCRRNGKHHCMTGMTRISSDGLPNFRTKSSECPYRSQIATPSGVAQQQSSRVSAFELPCTILVLAVDSRFFDSRLVTSNSQRGPPAFWR